MGLPVVDHIEEEREERERINDKDGSFCHEIIMLHITNHVVKPNIEVINQNKDPSNWFNISHYGFYYCKFGLFLEFSNLLYILFNGNCTI